MIKKQHGGRKVNSYFISFLVIVNFHVLYSCDKKNLAYPILFQKPGSATSYLHGAGYFEGFKKWILKCQ